MRQLFDHARALVVRFVRENAWVPLAARALGIAASMLLLAGIGAGWLDGALDLGPPRAEAAAMPRRASSSAERPPGTPHAPSLAAMPSSSSSSSSSASASASAPPASAPPAAAPAAGKAAPGAAKVVLNAATETELQRLPGVGPAKARAMVALREKLGGKFKRFEDLLRVRGIKRRSLERIRESAVLDPPPPEEPPPPPPPSSASGHAPPGRPPEKAP